MAGPLHPSVPAFAAVADEYEQGRPEYPPGVLDVLARELGLGPGTEVLDLAAGTGKLTRLVKTSGARVVAVEPLPELRGRIDAAEVLDGSAESIPLPSATIDVATVGDAWHWFDHQRAADELARVVRGGGGVALAWQAPREEPPDWFRAVFDRLRPLRGDHPNFRGEQGRPALDRHPAFDGLVPHTVAYSWQPGRSAFVAFVLSSSFVGSLPERERGRLRDDVAALLPPGPLQIPYAATVWVTRRRLAA